MSQELNRIVQGDCVAALAKLPAGSVDLVFADPPFNIGYDYDVYNDSKGQKEYLSWSRRWIEGVRRALKPTGTFWLAIGDEYAAELKVLSQEIGFHCRSWVVWYYTFGVNCKYKFSRSHVHLFQFVVNPKKYTFNTEAIRVPSARQLVYADGRANPDGRLPDDTWILRPQDCVDGFTPDEDTWYFPRVAGTFKERAGFHGCQMPEQLLGRIIKSCSNPGELVLDPFSGSATTLVVAKKLKRRFLGFELSKEYVQRGTTRLQNVHPEDPLEGAPEPLVSAPATVNGKTRDRESRSKQIHATQNAPASTSQEFKKKPVRAVPVGREHSPRLITEEISQALLEAFLKTHDGYSLDRVVADVKINRNFISACRNAGISGEPADWNRMMFRLRKAGRLAAFPTERRTQFDPTELDDFIDASEIAWRVMQIRTGLSLDGILCDPQLAAEFDQLAMAYAPGFDALKYRWGALTIRKMANKTAQLASKLDDRKPTRLCQVANLDVHQLFGQPGVYVVADSKDRTLYVGESFNLGARLKRSFFECEVQAQWEKALPFDEIKVATLQLTDESVSFPQLVARQTALFDSRKANMDILAKSAS